MRIEYEGKTYHYDPDELTVKQAGKIEKHIWKGSVAAAAAGARSQVEVLAQRTPTADVTLLRQAVDDLASMSERSGNGTLLDWEQGMLQARSDCLQALAWLLLHDGRLVPIADVDVKVIKLHRALITAMQAEAAETAETAAGDEPAGEDPTGEPPSPAAGKPKSRGRSSTG